MFPSRLGKHILLGTSCLAAGYAWGVNTERSRSSRELPSGLPRSCIDGEACCDSSVSLSAPQTLLPDTLKRIVGENNVITQHNKQAMFTTGARIGKGDALAVCRPGSLKEAVDALRACVEADVVIIPQGKNTGLTGGSVPRSECARPTVVMNMSRIDSIHPVGDQMLCLAGAGIYDLSKAAAARGRESHSVLGSIFLNPSVAAGVAFGSGGTQIRKGPAYTERAVWCRVTSEGTVEIVNTLGLQAKSEEELLHRLNIGEVSSTELHHNSLGSAHDSQYASQVCKLDDDVSRYNADLRGIDPCRCEGKVMVLASLHDTFPVPTERRTLWVACESLEQAQALKKLVLMVSPEDLPVSCEYMDRDTVDVVDRAGRGLCFAIQKLGIGGSLSVLWNVKIWVESLPLPFCDTLPDNFLYCINNLLPPSLPPKIREISKQFDHHLLINLGEFGTGNLKRTEQLLNEFCKRHPTAKLYMCSDEEVGKVTYFRFAAAPAFRTWCVGEGTQGLSLDYALRKNDEACPPLQGLTGRNAPLVRMRYAHFGCNVVHEDIAFSTSANIAECKDKIKQEIESVGGMLPAEHGHGTEYAAPQQTQERWKKMDPTNAMNPGVGGLGYSKNYSE